MFGSTTPGVSHTLNWFHCWRTISTQKSMDLGMSFALHLWGPVDEHYSRYTTLKHWLKGWGLNSSRKQAHTFAMIAGPIRQLKKRFLNAGALMMQGHLWDSFHIRVPK